MRFESSTNRFPRRIAPPPCPPPPPPRRPSSCEVILQQDSPTAACPPPHQYQLRCGAAARECGEGQGWAAMQGRPQERRFTPTTAHTTRSLMLPREGGQGMGRINAMQRMDGGKVQGCAFFWARGGRGGGGAASGCRGRRCTHQGGRGRAGGRGGRCRVHTTARLRRMLRLGGASRGGGGAPPAAAAGGGGFQGRRLLLPKGQARNRARLLRGGARSAGGGKGGWVGWSRGEARGVAQGAANPNHQEENRRRHGGRGAAARLEAGRRRGQGCLAAKTGARAGRRGVGELGGVGWGLGGSFGNQNSLLLFLFCFWQGGPPLSRRGDRRGSSAGCLRTRIIRPQSGWRRSGGPAARCLLSGGRRRLCARPRGGTAA
jgi:hypothetical protein